MIFPVQTSKLHTSRPSRAPSFDVFHLLKILEHTPLSGSMHSLLDPNSYHRYEGPFSRTNHRTRDSNFYRCYDAISRPGSFDLPHSPFPERRFLCASDLPQCLPTRPALHVKQPVNPPRRYAPNAEPNSQQVRCRFQTLAHPAHQAPPTLRWPLVSHRHPKLPAASK